MAATLTAAAAMLVPSKQLKSSFEDHQSSFLISSIRSLRNPPKTNYSKTNHHYFSPVMRLFGPAIFEASKLSVLFLGVDKEKHPELPRTYTLTHSDITSNLTLAISRTINNSQLQGWYSKLQRDEVVAEWKKVKGNMSLHVHCHISGGHFLLDLLAHLRYYIFCKELPVVLKAFMHGDIYLFNNYPQLQKDAIVYVYFHSNLPQYNKVECWGPFREAAGLISTNILKTRSSYYNHVLRNTDQSPMLMVGISDDKELSEMQEQPCEGAGECCFPSTSVIPWSESLPNEEEKEIAFCRTQQQDINKQPQS